MQAILVCAAPKGRIWGPFGLKTGIEPISVWHRVWFSRELLECMNVLMNKNEIEICDFEMH